MNSSSLARFEAMFAVYVASGDLEKRCARICSLILSLVFWDIEGMCYFVGQGLYRYFLDELLWKEEGGDF